MRFVLAVLIPVLLPAQTRVQKKSKFEIGEVRATGCVRRAPENHCLLLHTLDGTTTYTFQAKPEPELGTIITISGQAHQGHKACKEGIEIDITDWQPTGQQCEAAKK
ncbi:MAG TPA: hypothetical protein VME17_20825 [Bryobacteraceae bacterium]|nr:hypothetical protein [Bryobacteraceae bacterium]